MKTLVTGASGFIGSAVVRRLLAKGRHVRALVESGSNTRNLDRLDIELIEGDVRDRAALANAIRGVDAIFHLAAIYRLWLPRKRLIYEVNVEGTRNLLLAALGSNVQRIVHTSSIAAIGWPGPSELADENTEFQHWEQADDYVRSKWLSEREVMDFAAHGLPIVVVNPAFPFGERDTTPTPTGRFIVEILTGRMFGFPEGGFNAIDVDDVADGHLLAEERGQVGQRYILGNHNLMYREFFQLVTDVAGLPPITRCIPRAAVRTVARLSERYAAITRNEPYITVKAAEYACRRVWFDNTKARCELGLPKTPLRETLTKAIHWFRANGYT